MRQLCLSIRRRRRRSHRRSLARSSSSGYLSPLQFRCSSSSLAIYAAVAVVVAQVSRVESIHVPCQVASQPHRVAVGRARSARRRRRRTVGGRRRLDRRTARGAVKARSVRRDRQAAARGLLAHRRRATTTAEAAAAAAVSCRAITRIRDGRTKPSPPSSSSSSSSSSHGRTGSVCGKVNHRGGRSVGLTAERRSEGIL